MSKVHELFEKELCVVNGNRWLAEIKRLPVI